MKPKPKPLMIIIILIAVLSAGLLPAAPVYAEHPERINSADHLTVDKSLEEDSPILLNEAIPEENSIETVPEKSGIENENSKGGDLPSQAGEGVEIVLEEADTGDSDCVIEEPGNQTETQSSDSSIENGDEDPAFASPDRDGELSADPSEEIPVNPEGAELTETVHAANAIGSCSYISNDGSRINLSAPAVTVKNFGEDDRRVKITWSRVDGADGYLVYRSKKKDSGYTLITREEIRYSFVDDGLKPNTAYYYKVRAFRYEEPGEGFYRLQDPYYSGTLSSAKRIRTKKTVADGRDFDKASYNFIDYASYRKKDVIVSKATDSAAKNIYKRLKKGKNFTVYVKKKDYKSAKKVMDSLVKKVRKLSDARIGFRYTRCYGAGKLKYQLFEVDALEHKYVRKYMKTAYQERMAAYKEYIDCGCSPDYYTEKGVFYGPSFISSPFECAYGTSLKDLSTESLLLFILPCTKHVVGCDYMTYNNWTYDNNILGISGFIRLSNKSANGVCSNFADMTQRLCDYLGIKCWYVDSCYDLFHTWAVAKVKTEAGETVYYYIDTEIAFQIKSADCLGVWQKKATKGAMGKAYPW